jgi:hypothetical protein
VNKVVFGFVDLCDGQVAISKTLLSGPYCRIIEGEAVEIHREGGDILKG